MRVIALLFFAAIMQVSASTNAQKLTYVQKNASLEQLFKEIKKQTGYNIVWYEGKLNPEWLVNANFRKTPLKDVMDIALTGMQLDYTISNKTVVIKEKEMSLMDKLNAAFSNIVVRGRVVDETGAGLQGASVKVKNTNKVTITDVDGHFTLNGVPEKATLVISYLGYETKEVEASEKMENLQLISGAGKLEEVQINAGYYTVTDRERTSNITKITSATIERQPVLNPLQALQNRVPGMQITQTTGVPGGGFNVLIRGRSSVNSIVGNRPLYIIDDVIFPSTGVSSNNQLSLFGIEGASPLSSINPNDIESIEVLKDADATAIYGSRGANGVVLIKTKTGKSGVMKINASFTQALSQVAKKLDLLNTDKYMEMRMEALKNDGLTPSATDYDINGTWDKTKYTDWQEKLIGGNANTSNASLNASGGTEKINYLLGGNYYRETTVFPGDFDFNRFGIRSNLNLGSPNDKLKISFSGTFNHTQNNLLASDPTTNIFLAPNAPDAFDQNGQLNWENNTVYTNPMASLLFKNNMKTDNLIINTILSYRLFNKLIFKTSGGYNLLKIEDFVKTPLIGQAPARNPTPANRRSSFSNTSINSWQIEPQLNFKSKLGIGDLDALLGSSFQQNISESRAMEANNFSSDELMDNILAAGTITPTAALYTQYRYSALFARLNYSIENKFFVNLTGRRDGSTRFGKDKQFANFGAVGIAYLFSEEKFMKDKFSFLSLGKLRASYGITGNDQIGDYKYLSTWNAIGAYQGSSTLSPTLGNADYSWETNNKLELALQLGFLESLASIEISYYNNKSSNQLVGDPLPPSSGNVSIIANRPAKVRNSGLEFISDFKLLNSRNFLWSVGLNLTIPRNKLLSYPDIDKSSDALNYLVGESLSIKRIYNLKGVNSQTGLYDIEDRDGNGVINTKDIYLQKFTGQYFYGGFHNSLRFKNLTFDFLVSINKQNGNMPSSTMPGRFNSNLYPRSNQLLGVLNRWRQVGDDGPVQKFSTTTSSATAFSNAQLNGGLAIVDASYARLKNISLSYTLSKKWLSKFNISNASILLSGQNIFTVTHYKGLDPETQSPATLPPLRTFAMGINLTL